MLSHLIWVTFARRMAACRKLDWFGCGLSWLVTRKTRRDPRWFVALFYIISQCPLACHLLLTFQHWIYHCKSKRRFQMGIPCSSIQKSCQYQHPPLCIYIKSSFTSLSMWFTWTILLGFFDSWCIRDIKVLQNVNMLMACRVIGFVLFHCCQWRAAYPPCYDLLYCTTEHPVYPKYQQRSCSWWQTWRNRRRLW